MYLPIQYNYVEITRNFKYQVISRKVEGNTNHTTQIDQ